MVDVPNGFISVVIEFKTVWYADRNLKVGIGDVGM